ncbi:calcium channel flower isoform X1 [Tribolium madens]|uniref:calcium channel flower isoform X1 n=1 Tax=Tribolium madens TaxID=41895 RepID=UPI001CF74268|nr:calcium channel flower isoform X1 [Tribolium madens]
MSFQDKLASIMARPGQDPVAKDDVPWWMKYLGRGVGTVGSVIAILLGVWNCVGILIGNVPSLISGMWQVVAAFMVICCEAPCCCMFVDHVQRFSDWVERRPYWNRALGYVILSIPPVILCPGLSSIFGSGLIFTTGVIYGMMALGRKATAEEMRQAAAADAVPPSGTNRPNSMHANLVANAQPISLTGAPVYDSNV